MAPLLALALTGSALAADAWSTPGPGLRYLYRTASGPVRIHALFVDLCEPGIAIRATTSGERRRSVPSWGNAVGAVAAINGDFFSYADYSTSGLSVGNGVPWADTRDDSSSAIMAFGEGRAAVIREDVTVEASDWIVDAVSGHPGLLENGVDTASVWDERHPRTAAGVSEDGETLIMVVVDGRSSSSVGMTVGELRDLMRDLGAWDATNLDGGGSSTMWLDAYGTVNAPSDGTPRTVANHLGVVYDPGAWPDGKHCGDFDGDGWTTNAGDCDDEDAAIHPGATELCDAIDNDCQGGVDEGFDVDGDDYRTCDGDCDDADPTRHPGAPEDEDRRDDDCDYLVDEGTPAFDDDGDGWTERAGDCDDADRMRFPAAPERPDGRDDDCDGATDEGTALSDDDGDGVAEAAGDCDDTDATIGPSAAEAPNARDDDCDGRVDEGTARFDDDGDGFAETAGDCDDAAPLAFPGAPEIEDARDNDCNVLVDDRTPAFDDDGDGWIEHDGDCDDTAADVFPDAPEVADLRDEDCDGLVDDQTEAFDDDHDG
ncbi:MAG: MopE-related protein, partial [Myxococcota bacterium]